MRKLKNKICIVCVGKKVFSLYNLKLAIVTCANWTFHLFSMSKVNKILMHIQIEQKGEKRTGCKKTLKLIWTYICKQTMEIHCFLTKLFHFKYFNHLCILDVTEAKLIITEYLWPKMLYIIVEFQNRTQKSCLTTNQRLSKPSLNHLKQTRCLQYTQKYKVDCKEFKIFAVYIQTRCLPKKKVYP